MDDTKLTKSFKLYEFKVSSDYPEIAHAMDFDELEHTKLFLLCMTILQPVRNYIRAKVTITSGKRNDALNVAIGGSKTSQHKYCEASDFVLEDLSKLLGVFTFIRKYLTHAYLQLILYLDEDYNPKFIHVSLPGLNTSKTRKVLIHVNGEYKHWRKIWYLLQR